MGKFLGAYQHRSSTVVERACIERSDASGRFERGFEGRCFFGFVARGALVRRDYGVALFAFDGQGRDFIFKKALRLRAKSPLVRGMRVGILFFPGELVVAHANFGGVSHMEVIVDVPQAVFDHRVHDFAVAHAQTFAQFRHEIRCMGHGFHAPSERGSDFSGSDCGIGEHDGLEAGSTDLAHGGARSVSIDTGTQSGLASGGLTHARCEHTAHKHLVDFRGSKPRSFESRAQNFSA